MMKRVFLGWEEPVLAISAKWLLSNFQDLSEVRVVVRGSRAGRRLLEKLAVEADRQKRPLFLPKIATIARIVDELFTAPVGLLPAAPELTQKLAWMEALRRLSPAKKSKLFQTPEGLGGSGQPELLLAQRLLTLRDELGGEGLGFAEVARVMSEKMPEAPAAEPERWELVGEVFAEVQKILEKAGWMDPADRRAVLAERGTPQQVQVVLAGVVEIRPVFMKMLQRLSKPPQVLVFAPEEEKDGFDEVGRLRPEYWSKRKAVLESGQIHAVGRSADQAARLAEMAKAWPGATLAVADEKAVAGIREALREEGMESHWAEGRKMREGRVAGFLRAVADYVSRKPDEAPSWESAALLMRHPDGCGGVLRASEVLDSYAEKHVPEKMDPAKGSPAVEWAEKLAEKIRLKPEEVSASVQAQKVSNMLVEIYGKMEVNLDLPSGRMMRDSLQKARKVMAELVSLKLPYLEKIRTADFLRLVLAEMEDERVPEPSRAGAVEMVGWLELAEEDSPSVAVASFHEGAVPKSVTADEFLPGHLRKLLGVNDNVRRLARDAYALAVVLGTRAEKRGIVGLVVPSFNPAGDPVKPSRLLLTGLKGKDLAARVLALTEKPEGEKRAETFKSGAGFGDLPAGKEKIDRVSVTAFRDYLKSPRYFYFRSVLGLADVEDEPGELSPAGFGSLIHRVVGAFGKDKKLRESTDEKGIFAFLKGELDRQAKERFGDCPKAAVGWQLEMAEARLEAFARVQARERVEGWQILVAEGEKGEENRKEFALKDAQGRELLVQGRPDRVDWNEKQKRWRVVDVKTSSTPKTPDRAHCDTDGTWSDLQMPLYRELAPLVLGEAAKGWDPEKCDLVYLHLPKDVEKAAVSKPMDTNLVERALQKASEVAADILDGKWKELGTLDPETTAETFMALCGQAGIPREIDEEEAE
jgi:ATP-dependent helicase/nuclease subunit B